MRMIPDAWCSLAVLSLWLFCAMPAQAETPPEPADTSSPSVAEPSESAPPSDLPWPSKISPLVLSSSDGSHKLRLAFVAQMHYQMDAVEDEPGEGRDISHRFRWRRVRLDLRGSLPAAKFDYRLHLNVSPGALELMDLYVNYALTPTYQFRLGQQKIPFTRHRLNSFTNLQFVDWALVSPWFGAERQVGLTLHNGYKDLPLIEYEVGVYTGQNVRKSHGVGVAMAYEEKRVNPSSLTDPAPLDEFHPAFAWHLAYNYNGIRTSYDTDFEKREFRFTIGASMVADIRPVEYRDAALRAAFEALMKVRGFSLGGMYYLLAHETDAELDIHGAQLHTSYLIGDHVELALRYATVMLVQSFREELRDRSATLRAALSDPTDNSYLSIGTLQDEHEITFGVNVYVIGRNLKWQTDTSWLLHSLDSGTTHDFRVRSQLQLAF